MNYYDEDRDSDLWAEDQELRARRDEAEREARLEAQIAADEMTWNALNFVGPLRPLDDEPAPAAFVPADDDISF